MKIGMNMVAKLEQQMRLAPQIIQSIEILQMPLLELQNMIELEREENPTLELEEESEEYLDRLKEYGEMPEASEKEANLETPTDVMNEYEKFETMDYDWSEDFDAEPRRSKGDGENVKMEAIKNVIGNTCTLQEHLSNQLHLMDLEDKTLEIAEFLAFNIDNNGYLQFTLEELLQSLNNETEQEDQEVLPECTLEELEEILEIIQNLEPLGVGARSIQECLLLQLRSDEHEYVFEKELIQHHLEDIEKNRIPKIAKERGRSIEEIKKTIDVISHLNPRPGSVFSEKTPQYIIPDIVVEHIDKKYEVRLESKYIPRLTISQKYRQILTDGKADETTKEFVKKKLESAKWLIDAIAQRQSTLSRIARELVDYQEDFLDDGVQSLKPLKMQIIADVLGIHVSTVSRAINGKYMQTPRGIFALKYFFTGGTSTSSGEVESRQSIKQMVSDIIDKEDKSSPLSDDEIAGMLQSNGLDIARRTVAKYRKALRIPSSRQRREY